MISDLVGDVMHRGLVGCWVDESLLEVAQRLCDDSIHAVFVLDRNGKALGVISQIDLAEAYLQDDWQQLTAGEIMVREVISVTENTPLNIAIERMLNRNIHRLLVTYTNGSQKKPIGVLSLSDVICDMARERS